MNFFITSRTKSDKQWKKKNNIFFIIAHFSKQYNPPFMSTHGKIMWFLPQHFGKGEKVDLRNFDNPIRSKSGLKVH